MFTGFKVSFDNHKLTSGHTIVNKLLGGRTALKIEDLYSTIHGITVSSRVPRLEILQSIG